MNAWVEELVMLELCSFAIFGNFEVNKNFCRALLLKFKILPEMAKQ